MIVAHSTTTQPTPSAETAPSFFGEQKPDPVHHKLFAIERTTTGKGFMVERTVD